MRPRNARAERESSTINARFSGMVPPVWPAPIVARVGGPHQCPRTMCAFFGATLCSVKMLLAGLALMSCTEAAAISRISIDCAILDWPGQFQARQVHAAFTTNAGNRARMRASAAHITVAGPANYGIANAAVEVDYAVDSQLAQFGSGRLQFAGAEWQVRGRWQAGSWQLNAASSAAPVATLSGWLQWQPPADYRLAGTVALQVEASGRQLQLRSAVLGAELRAINLQNDAGTVVAENVAARLEAGIRGTPGETTAQLRLTSSSGQALLGPVFLDLAAQPLIATGQLRVLPTALQFSAVKLQQRELLEATGTATLARQPRLQLQAADIVVSSLRFPAAFASFMQLPLATTNFGALETRGSLSGQLTVRNGALQGVDAAIDDIDISDKARGLQLLGMHGVAHWHAADQPSPAESPPSWRDLRVADLVGGASSAQLMAHGSALTLAAPARIAIFDGALAIQRFESQRLGSADVTLGFDANIEPISMQQLSVAFGWPPMAGTLSGRVPGLAF